MEISAKELRGKPTQIIEQASRGTEVVITIRGKKMAKLIPYLAKDKDRNIEDDIFGIWNDKDIIKSVDEYVRSIRRGRTF
jgi:prevent-host-death family protein